MTMPKDKKDKLTPTQKAFFDYIEKKQALQKFIAEGKSLNEYSEKYGVQFYTPISVKEERK